MMSWERQIIKLVIMKEQLMISSRDILKIIKLDIDELKYKFKLQLNLQV